jgi:TldD protein
VKNIATAALEAAERAGADYADARAVERTEEIHTARGRDALSDLREERGLAIRALASGAWGFAATADLSSPAVRAAAEEAVAGARAAALFAERPATLGRGAAGPLRYETAVRLDPRGLKPAEKLALARLAVQAATRAQAVHLAECRIRFIRERAWIAAAGAPAAERLLRFTAVGLRAHASVRGRNETRTWPAQGGGVFTGGLEVLGDLEEAAARAGEEAEALCAAAPCPEAVRDVVLDPWAAASLLHETLGHALEADRPSFAAPAGLGKEVVGSPSISLTLDPTVGRGAGTMGIDDEGLSPRAVALVGRGVVLGVVSDRATGAGAAARAASWRDPPLPRLTNLTLAPGRGDLSSLLDGVDGVYLQGARAYTVDARRSAFRFVAEVAWEVQGGKRTRMLRGAALGGPTAAFWKACDAVAGEGAAEVAGLWCDREGRRVGVGHVCPPLRLRRVPVGPRGA